VDGKGLKLLADKKAHKILVDGLLNLYPDIPIISEEDDSHSDIRPEYYWIIDPIDGTASWLDGFDGFVVQIALIKNKKPVYSMVYAPALDKTYYALKGKGAFLNGNRINVLNVQNKGLTIVDNTSEPCGISKLLFDSLSATNYVESGSLGLKCCLVAEGVADLFIKDVVVRDWDIAPAYLILLESGGKLTLPTGEEYIFDGPIEKTTGVVAVSSNSLANKVYEIIKYENHVA